MTSIQVKQLLCSIPSSILLEGVLFLLIATAMQYFWCKANIEGYHWFSEVFNFIEQTKNLKRYFFNDPGFLYIFISMIAAIVLGKYFGDWLGRYLLGGTCV